ncbi:glycosyltransferase family 1 protein [Schizophyllum amplum]|uniref:Glycosyltransferase family 1 protein n=1 Tax=Schizophyllum amplum TaxID=97359 RepID=A0A550CYS9_9AGAR|nr:glycosyltransferase family 1 protein [Auriculariopsis ampla]
MVDILFLTLGEHGQASVHLATAFELYSRRMPGINIHVASSADLEARFDQVKARIDTDGDESRRSTISFHTVLPAPYKEALFRPGFDWSDIAHPPMQKSSKGVPRIAHTMCPFLPDEYVRGVDGCSKLLQMLSPDVVLVDMLFCQAIDACKLLDQRYIILSPLPGCDVSVGNAPWHQALFYYPSIGTDAPFPLSWKASFCNALNLLRIAYAVLSSPHLHAINAARKERGCTWTLPVLTATSVSPDTPCIAAGIPELDFPFTVPEALNQFGPICVPNAPLAEADPELKTWLDGGETILMIMGSHIAYNETLARSVLQGLLAGAGDRQILWKVSTVEKLRALFDEMLTTEHDRQRVRIVRWFEIEPAAIVEHENVVCYIHHGGANSYLECARSGTPQIILPMWYDTYTNATRLEYCGLGVYGSKTAAPGVDPGELEQAMLRVVSGPESVEFRYRAREVGIKCREAGGRERVADSILDYLTWSVNGSPKR